MQPPCADCGRLMTMATKSKAALELKRLRDHAGYSVRQLATALRDANSKYGHSPSSYAYYENDYKKPYLPVDLVNALVPLMLGCGDPPITERQVLILAGTEHDSLWQRRIEFDEMPGKHGTSTVDATLLGDILEGLGTEAAARLLRLESHHKARLAAEVYERVADIPADQRAMVLQREIGRVMRLAKIFLQERD